MKQLNINKITLPALLTILWIPCIRADVPIHEDKISLYGYVAGSISYTWQNYIHGESNENEGSAALDAAKLGLAFAYSPVSARLSVYVPDTEMDTKENIYLLEANATYAFRSENKLTFGRFQSWVGYEAFDQPARHFITAATTGRLDIIPTFHDGVKYEATTGKYSYGLAIIDSVYPSPGTPYRGDGDIGKGYAVEGRVGYKGRNLSSALIISYQRDRAGDDTDTWVGDAHAEYFFPRTQTTIGGEICYKTTEPMAVDRQGWALKNNRTDTYFGLVTVRQKMGEKSTLNFRISTGHQKVRINTGQTVYTDGSPVSHGGTIVLFTKFSMGFSHSVNKHLDFRGEASYTDYTNTLQGAGQIAKETFIGIQILLKL